MRSYTDVQQLPDVVLAAALGGPAGLAGLGLDGHQPSAVLWVWGCMGSFLWCDFCVSKCEVGGWFGNEDLWKWKEEG